MLNIRNTPSCLQPKSAVCHSRPQPSSSDISYGSANPTTAPNQDGQSKPLRRYRIVSSAVPITFLTWRTAASLRALVFSFKILTNAPHYSSNDALRKHGILPPLPKPPKTPSPPPSPTFEQILSTKDIDEIDILLLETEDSETERLILAFREQRLKDLRKEERKGRFGSVLPISRDDYNREVTEASTVDDRDEDEVEDDQIKGTGVVCFLYKQGYVAQLILLLALKGTELNINVFHAVIMPPACG